MHTNCQHCVGGDNTSFLLDDENASLKICLKCNHLANNENSNNIIWNTEDVRSNTVLCVNGVDPRAVSMDNHMDTLEDSPLLINDSYSTESLDDFHCHDALGQYDDKRAWKKLLIASVLCFIFMLTEVAGGYIAGSLAIMTDAAHLFSDFVGFLISLLSIWISRKAPTKTMTFGYYRAEVLGALISVLSIWILAAVFAVLAIARLWKKEYEIEPDTMLIVSCLGLLVNILMGSVLFGCCHGHSHGLSPHSDSSNSNINVRAAATHVIGDLVQSLGVLIAAIIIKVFPDAKMADPICTIIFSVVVIFTTVKVAKDAVWLLLEGSPINSADLGLELQGIAGVKHIHTLHIWTLAPEKDAVSAHLSVDTYCDRDLVLKKATSIIKSRFNVISCTVQIETHNESLVRSCQHCKC